MRLQRLQTPLRVRRFFLPLVGSCDSLHVVAERLKREGRLEINEAETMEELEDDEGNVYNRKTYDDLKNQGLI
jgi:hypothetical protein